MNPEDLLKLAVNYGLGMLLSVGIAVVFFLHLKDERKEANAREEWFKNYIETKNLTLVGVLQEHIKEDKQTAIYQRQEHEQMIGALGLIKDSLNSLNIRLQQIPRGAVQ